MTYAESTLLRRRARVHNMDMDVVEHVGIVTGAPLRLKPRKRLMDNSTNMFNHLGPITSEAGLR